MPNSIVLGTGRSVPARSVPNREFEAVMDTTDEWIRTRTGIESRHWISPGETGVELGRRAAVAALEMAGIGATDLDAIVYATITPDHFLPGNGVFVQRALGANSIPAIDIRQQCSGFVYALAIADGFIKAGVYRRVLVVGQEVQSTRMDVSTRGRHTAVLFADGAGAVVLGPCDDPQRGILGYDLHTDGRLAEKLWVDEPGAIRIPTIDQGRYQEGRYFLEMDGKEVYRHATQRMPESVQTCLGKLNLTPADISLLIPHQANLRISEAVQKGLGLSDAQVYNNIQRYGNTTAATIPIALDECVRASRIEPGDLVVLTAFGSGFAWGTVALRW
ncbi:MAG: ketoacyl-ACP synthase III [Gemmatimonadetes bacterium]|nr:ketoacyl-ACP synthase III [Gemmatimonadota bacterium]